jgi:hypothetical protein
MDSWEINANRTFDRRHLSFFRRWWLDIDKINFLIVLAIMLVQALQLPKELMLINFSFLKNR